MVFGSVRSHDAEVRRIAGISGSLLWALSEIAESGGISVNELAERMALHQTTASNILLALADRGLVKRVRDGADQRVVRLHVTTAGKRTLLRAPGPYPGLLVDALRHLDERHLARREAQAARARYYWSEEELEPYGVEPVRSSPRTSRPASDPLNESAAAR